MNTPKAIYWSLISLESGNLLASWVDKEEAEKAFAQILKEEPETKGLIALITFDAEGMALDVIHSL